jgi:pSer/pThr/pTyr-binding forkhead associated (FHA) protein
MVYLRSLDDQIQIHIQEGQNLLVGRLLKCDVVLEDGSVSSQHARLQLKDNQLRVVDMGSTNGTRINYSSIDGPSLLLDGDTVEFGNLSFTVDGPQLESPPANQMAISAIVDLDPLDASQQLSDTMLSIPLPSEEELDAELSGYNDAASDSSDENSESETETDDAKERTPNDPMVIGFRIALLTLLISGALLCLLAWLNPLSI